MLEINCCDSQGIYLMYYSHHPHLSDYSWCLSLCFSSPLPSQPDRRREALKCLGLAELLFKSWLERDMCCIPASSDSQAAPPMALLGAVCRQCMAHSKLLPFKKLPPELCAQNLIQHAKSVCRSPDCLPNTLNLYSGITLSGDVSVLKSASTHMQVYRHSGSHIQ